MHASLLMLTVIAILAGCNVSTETEVTVRHRQTAGIGVGEAGPNAVVDSSVTIPRLLNRENHRPQRESRTMNEKGGSTPEPPAVVHVRGENVVVNYGNANITIDNSINYARDPDNDEPPLAAQRAQGRSDARELVMDMLQSEASSEGLILSQPIGLAASHRLRFAMQTGAFEVREYDVGAFVMVVRIWKHSPHRRMYYSLGTIRAQ